MAKAFSITTGVPGLEVWINYNAANRRIQTVEWTIPRSGIVVRARIWNAGALVYDRTVGGPASGAENVPGNHQMVQVDDGAGGTYLDLPAYLTYAFNVESVGGR